MKKLYIAIMVILIITSVISIRRSQVWRDKASEYSSLYSSYMHENSALENKYRVLQMSLDVLRNSKDSIIESMVYTIDSLNLKLKNIKTVEYIKTEITKTDTLSIRDTVFVPNFKLDTLIYDNWYSLNLNMYYPNTIIVNPKFISDKYIITSYKKETINPPKRFFIARWFQKKHKIVEINVVEKNPYATIKEVKYVDIIKKSKE